jgi:hypothetical protein
MILQGVPGSGSPSSPAPPATAKSMMSGADEHEDQPRTNAYRAQRLRPVIIRLARRELAIQSRDELPCRIYSSHFHTAADPEEVWRQRFACFRWIHPCTDTYDAGGHRRRADLFIATDVNRLVSIEFKYVAPRRTPSVSGCASQVRQYLTKHKACLLVIYAGEPESGRLEAVREEIGRSIRSRRGLVVAIRGPAIHFG